MNFSQKLEKLMDKNNLTNYQLSKDLDVHPTTVANWLEGKAPRKKSAAALAKYFGVSTDYLLNDEQKENAPERSVTDEDIKFALFNGDKNATDEQFEEVKNYARYIAERDKNKSL